MASTQFLGTLGTRPGDAERLRLSGLAVVAPFLGTAELRFPLFWAQFGGHAACRAVAFPPHTPSGSKRPPAQAHAPAQDPKKPPTRAQRGRGFPPASRSLARRQDEGEASQPCARLRSPQRRLDEAWSWRSLRKASSEQPRWRRLLLFAEPLPKRQVFTRNERRSRPAQVPQSFPRVVSQGERSPPAPFTGDGGTQGCCPPQKHPLDTRFPHRRRLISGSPTLPPGGGGCLGLAPPPPGAGGAGKILRAASQRRFCRRVTPRCPRGARGPPVVAHGRVGVARGGWRRARGGDVRRKEPCCRLTEWC